MWQRTAAQWHGTEWACLSASAPLPRRPQQGRGGRELGVPAQMSSIHFPTSAYGGPLSTATEAEMMQFVGMSCHFHKLSNPQRPWPAEDKQGQLVVLHDTHTCCSCVP
ncbi:hypothetical protein ILYODFUR_004051 [Ilyodon furcidens]|uniref:Uncharacterized protein n=2 Tax=Goodeidae TaxID=28758 RepID=A0ABV0U4A3_9TELE